MKYILLLSIVLLTQSSLACKRTMLSYQMAQIKAATDHAKTKFKTMISIKSIEFVDYKLDLSVQENKSCQKFRYELVGKANCGIKVQKVSKLGQCN